jgi:hypothetical protein
MGPFVLKVPAVLHLVIFLTFFFAIAPAYPQTGGAFRLIGTIEGGTGFTGAVLDDDSGTQTFYRVREPLSDGSRIVKIESDKITIKRSDGSSYDLYLVQSSKPGVQSGRAAASPVAATDPVRRTRGQAPEGMMNQPNDQVPAIRETGSGDGAAGSKSRSSHKRRRPVRNLEKE